MCVGEGMHVLSQAKKYRQKKTGIIDTCTETQRKSKTKMCTKCSGSRETRTVSAARVVVCTRLTGEVTRLGREGRRGVSLELV